MVRYLSIATLALLLAGCSSGGVAGNGAVGEDTKAAAWGSKPGAKGAAVGGAGEAVKKKGG